MRVSIELKGRKRGSSEDLGRIGAFLGDGETEAAAIRNAYYRGSHEYEHVGPLKVRNPGPLETPVYMTFEWRG